MKPSFHAVYYDGVTSQSTGVEVSLDESGTLHVAGLAGPVAHPLASVRISPRLGNTTRALLFPNGAKCETSDHAALEALERAAGRGAFARLLHTLESRWRYALGAGLALVCIGFVGTKWGIPILARHIADAVPPRMAYDLGRGTLQVLDRTVLKPSELDQERKQQLTSEFAAMAKHYPNLPLTLSFRRGVGPNAFALPDGSVVVTDELVKLSQNDEEVLAVLAHEIGHVHHRHSLRMALESSTVVLLVGTYLGDVTQLTTLSASLPGVYAQAHYSREHETEADTFALHYLDQNGIPHHRFADILRALQKSVGADADSSMQYLASHPPTTERIQRFEK
jgi:Zn-dependent protease with chaperone function